MLVKIVSPLFFPVPVICEVLAAGVILLWVTRWQKAGRIMVTIGTIILSLLGNREISSSLIRPLEQRYDAVSLSSTATTPGTPGTKAFVVVLGGSYSPDPQIDLVSRISEETISRLIQGIRICREVNDCQMIFSGGPPAQAQALGSIASSLGVRPMEISLEENSHNTEQEALFIKPTVGQDPFFLVTSASHMPRAMGLFRKLGMKPIAVPTDYLSKEHVRITPMDLYPSYYGLYEAEKAVYEYLGLGWEKLNGEM